MDRLVVEMSLVFYVSVLMSPVFIALVFVCYAVGRRKIGPGLIIAFVLVELVAILALSALNG